MADLDASLFEPTVGAAVSSEPSQCYIEFKRTPYPLTGRYRDTVHRAVKRPDDHQRRLFKVLRNQRRTGQEQRSQVSISASAALVPATRPRRPPERRPLEVTPKKCYEDFKVIMSKKPLTTSADYNQLQPLEPSQQLSHIPIVSMAAAIAVAKSQTDFKLQPFRGNHGDGFFEQSHCS